MATTVTEIAGSGVAVTTAAQTLYTAAAGPSLGTVLEDVRVTCEHASNSGSVDIWTENSTGTIKAKLCKNQFIAPMTAPDAGNGGQLIAAKVRLAPGDKLRCQASANSIFWMSFLGGVQRG